MPTLGPRDVMVKVTSCGVCYHDVLVMSGVLRRGVKSNLVLGHEIAGEVVEIGTSVTKLLPGDLVASILTDSCGNCVRCHDGREHRCLNGVGIGHGVDGGFAEYVRVSENSLVGLNPGTDTSLACIYGCPMGVTLHALRDAGDLKAGETVLITGAGGGIGVHAVQIARASGARVIAVTTSPEKESRIRELGAHEVITAPDLDFGHLVMALTDDRGVEVVLNAVGTLAFKSCWTGMSQYGRMVMVGQLGRGEVSINPAEMLFKDAHIIGVSGTSKSQLGDVIKLVSSGRIQPVVSQTFPLEEASEAYTTILEKASFGRVTLTP